MNIKNNLYVYKNFKKIYKIKFNNLLINIIELKYNILKKYCAYAIFFNKKRFASIYLISTFNNFFLTYNNNLNKFNSVSLQFLIKINNTGKKKKKENIQKN